MFRVLNVCFWFKVDDFVVGLNLLKFRTRVDSDPYNSLASWDPVEGHMCNWKGVHCVNGKVHML